MLAYNEHDPFYVLMIQRWLKQGTFGRKGWGREKQFENLTSFSFINMRLELSQGNLLHAYGYRICFLKQDVGKLGPFFLWTTFLVRKFNGKYETLSRATVKAKDRVRNNGQAVFGMGKH